MAILYYINELLKENMKDNTQSEEFNKWFSDSKVVVNNKPRIVYHGTKYNLDEFDIDYATTETNNGFWFTSNKSLAREYGSIVIPVYLKIINPYIIDGQMEDIRVYDEELSNVDRHKYDGVIIYNVDDSMTGFFSVSDVYLVFNPNNIKSVDNDGSWSLTNNNIYL